ncbi:MAG: serine O-acetyltransferase [Akkermansia sp.]
MQSEKRAKLNQCRDCPCIVNGIWSWMTDVAQTASEHEPALRPLLLDTCLTRSNLIDSVAARLSRKLSRLDMPRENMEPLLREVLYADPSIIQQIAMDIMAIVDRDPACHSPIEPLLFFKGFHAITTYRIAHWLWNNDRHMMALQLQSISSEIFAVDIHPAAQIGSGILLDHATSFVVGETAIIKDNVSILHEVTLGGTGKREGNRHPIVESGVLIGAGAKILGRVTIGTCAKIAACSVVLNDVSPHTTVAGVPAVTVSDSTEPTPALDMNQKLCS